MARRLFVVEDTFAIKGRGLVLAPGILPEGDERFRTGDCIRLLKPDGSSIVTRIGGLELLCPNARHDVVIMLTNVAKADVPIGTEVWSVDTSEQGAAADGAVLLVRRDVAAQCAADAAERVVRRFGVVDGVSAKFVDAGRVRRNWHRRLRSWGALYSATQPKPTSPFVTKAPDPPPPSPPRSAVELMFVIDVALCGLVLVPPSGRWCGVPEPAGDPMRCERSEASGSEVVRRGRRKT